MLAMSSVRTAVLTISAQQRRVRDLASLDVDAADKPGSSRQSPSASRTANGAMAADSACDEVRGTAPGMLVTQKCVTPSH